MNAKRLATLLVGDTPRLRIAALALAGAAFLATACSGPVGTSSKPTAPRCADLVAHAVTNQPPQPVKGSYTCLAPNVQAEGAALGITDDASLAAYENSQTPVYTGYQYIGKSAPNLNNTPVYYYFELTPGPRCYRVSLDSHGLVDGGGFGPAKCPKPLP